MGQTVEGRGGRCSETHGAGVARGETREGRIALPLSKTWGKILTNGREPLQHDYLSTLRLPAT